MKIISKLLNKIKNSFQRLHCFVREETGYYRPAYRIVSIEKNEVEEYFVTIQVIGKSISYKTKPEKLLADDKLVNLFSPIDIRNLTYLGYLGINAPKYKILAKQLSEEKGQTLFAIHKKGDAGHHIVTATEISTNEEILQGLSQHDAHMVGFPTATEQAATEKLQKEELIRQLKNNTNQINKN